MKPASLLLALLVGLLAVSLSACGADSSSSSSSSSTTTAPETTTSASPAEPPEDVGTHPHAQEGRTPPVEKKARSPEPTFTPKPHHDSGGGSAQFRTKGGDNSIQEYGGETSSAEFEEAAAALHEFLDARAAGAWDAACARMAPPVAEGLAEQLGAGSGGKSPGCAEVLAGLSTGVPASALREAAEADVAALRAEGDSGFLLFHGAHGQSFFMPVQRSGGEWKVAAIAPSPLE